MKKIHFYNIKNINLNKKYKIFFIIGNDYINKQNCKIYIKKKILLFIKNFNIINIIINNKYNWNKLENIIINKNLFSKKKLIIINIIEEINKINKYIYKYIIKKIKKNNIIYFIINYNFDYLKNINFKKKHKNILIIICKKNIIYNKNNIFYNKYINSNYIKNIILLIYKNKIEKIFYIIDKIKKENYIKIILLNIIFKYFIKNLHKYNKFETKKILNLIKENEINIKKNININWINLKILLLLIINKNILNIY